MVPWEVPIGGGSIQGKIGSEVPKSSMRSTSSGGGVNILGKFIPKVLKSSMKGSSSGWGELRTKVPKSSMRNSSYGGGGLFWVSSYPKSLSPLWEVHFLEEGVFWMSSDLKCPSPPWEVLLQKHKHTWVMDISAQFKEWNYVLYRQQNLNNCNCKNLYYIESNNKKEHCTMYKKGINTLLWLKIENNLKIPLRVYCWLAQIQNS